MLQTEPEPEKILNPSLLVQTVWNYVVRFIPKSTIKLQYLHRFVPQYGIANLVE